MSLRTAFQIIEKLHAARESMEALYGREQFLERIIDYQAAIERQMLTPPQSEPLEAAMAILERLQEQGAHGIVQALLLGAAVEMIEPR